MWPRARRTPATPGDTPVFILCRDRVVALEELVGWLERNGFERIHFLDNDSAYEPLLDYYRRSPHDVISLGRNVGKNALWVDRRFKRLVGRRKFVYTDPDVVPVAECPHDALDRFSSLLDRHDDVTKVGFGLRIDDVPDRYRFKREVIEWESQFWDARNEVEPGVFRAPIDTTFALYRAWSSTTPPIDALRTGWPYVARHTTWYADSASPSEEDRFYAERAARGTPESPGTSSWSGTELPQGLRNSLERLRSAGS